jgi:hypothetical protein
MPTALAPGTKVIRIDGHDFHGLTVLSATDRYILASHPQGGECGATAACFLAAPDDWTDPPALHVSAVRAVESSYSGPIAHDILAAAEAADEGFPALVQRLDAAEAWLAWVQRHLHPLSPARFEPRLRAAEAAKEAAMRGWLEATPHAAE